MKAILIYDSVYGNTKSLAEAISRAIPGCALIHIGESKPADLEGVSLLIIGSPTHGGNATPALLKFMSSLPAGSLSGVQVASFDTWMTKEGQDFLTRTAIGIFGHAAPRIVKKLQSLGGQPVSDSAIGFLVKTKQGPLVDGEMEKAMAWAKKLAQAQP